MNPGLDVGPVTIYYYGVILAIAILVGYIWARTRAPLYKVPVELIDATLIVVVPLAILGARLYFVLFNLDYFRANVSEVLNFRGGGMAIHGALLGGALGLVLVWLNYRRKAAGALKFSSLLDLMAPVLPLSQAVGRFANYVNQEAFGGPSDLPWAISINPEHRPREFAGQETFHPTFAYEALWNLVGVAILLVIERRLKRAKKQARGLLFAVYLAWYSLGRFWIEGLRTDSLYLGSLRIAQIVSVVALLGSLGFIWYRLAGWRANRTAHVS